MGRFKKMKRIDRVYRELENAWSKDKVDRTTEEHGSTAEEISKILGITRANTSSDLNQLVRLKKAVKIKSYPVRYLASKVVEEMFDLRLSDSQYEVKKLNNIKKVDFNEEDQLFGTPSKRDAFEEIIGNKDSFFKPISQAKAALHYPPDGLHMILLGPTGSGKTFFANKIYQYAKIKGIIDSDAPFESFNCADYYNNNQLLISHLFGYAKGAFTGADSDYLGLVERANGGILFLDEIHRLPPEGQEMLFYFIDKGMFSRLGENGKKRESKVLIICATTEDPKSSLLSTFLRRIPMIINIPSLTERSLEERINLIKYLFLKETERVDRTLKINIDVFNALLNFENNYGNVGQLKSHIQLTCAHSFLNQLYDQEELFITMKDLPEEIQHEYVSSSQNITDSKKLASLLEIVTSIYPNNKASNQNDGYNELNIYRLMEEKADLLYSEGRTKEEVQERLLDDAHIYIESFVSTQKIDYDLLKFVDPIVSQLTKKLKSIAEESLKTTFDSRFLYYIGLHLDSIYKSGVNRTVKNLDYKQVQADYPEEYKTVRLMTSEIECSLSLELPEVEQSYLTMLLSSLYILHDKRKVAILVAAHGIGTAKSMVSVAVDLLGNAPIDSLDIPLTVPPEEIIYSLMYKIKQLDNGRGVLILADMGSITMMNDRLKKELDSEIRTISNVTTSMVLDAVRKVNYIDISLVDLYHSVINDYIGALENTQFSDKKKAILSICMTGSGTAEKIKNLVSEIVKENTNDTIQVITISQLELAAKIKKIKENYQIIASVGTDIASIEIPHISLESLVAGSGENFLARLVQSPNAPIQPYEKRENIIAKDVSKDTLVNSLIYLNPHYIQKLLTQWTKELEISLGLTFSSTLIIKLVVHTAFAYERAVTKRPLSYKESHREELDKLFSIISETLNPIEEVLNLKLNDDEKLYIAEILKGE